MCGTPSCIDCDGLGGRKKKKEREEEEGEREKERSRKERKDSFTMANHGAHDLIMLMQR